VFEYTYLLFWNSFWTLAPVIGIGLFDRIVGMCITTLSLFVLGCLPCSLFQDADVLMNFPELYRHGREGKWFGLKWFTIYMFDGVMQVRCLRQPKLFKLMNMVLVCCNLLPYILQLYFCFCEAGRMGC
jgi:hypothetical protein